MRINCKQKAVLNWAAVHKMWYNWTKKNSPIFNFSKIIVSHVQWEVKAMTVKDFISVLSTLNQESEIKIVSISSDNNIETEIDEADIDCSEPCYKLLVDG